MNGLARLILGAALAVFACAGAASAHTKSETQSVWRLAGPEVHIAFTVPDVEAKRLEGPDHVMPSDTQIAAYLAGKLSVLSKNKPCPRIGPVQPETAAQSFHRFELKFECPTIQDMTLHSDAFFELVPSHVTFAQIVDDQGNFSTALFTKDERTQVASATGGGGKLQRAGFFDFVRMGMMHIFTGIDHMSFILGFIIIARNLRDLLFVVTGFTIGHSLTLAVAVTGLFRPHAQYIDALIGLTIALVGAENISVASRRPATVAASVIGLLGLMALGALTGLGGLPALLLLGAGIFSANYLMVSGHLRDAARVRLVVTLAFGLIHGFGFAANLLDERLPKTRLAELLVGFNVGVEIGQVCVVFVVLGLVFLLSKMKLTLPRPLVIDVVSAGLVGFGLYLFVSRGYA